MSGSGVVVWSLEFHWKGVRVDQQDQLNPAKKDQERKEMWMYQEKNLQCEVHFL